MLPEESILSVEFKENKKIDYKKVTSWYGAPKPLYIIEIDYLDSYFDATIETFKPDFDSDTFITLCKVKDGILIDQEDYTTNNLKLNNNKIIFEYELVYTNAMVSIHPKIIEASETYLSERKKWLRDIKIKSLLS